MTNEEIEVIRQRYIDYLEPLFFPEDPVSNDIVKYFASLLRIVGMEDRGGIHSSNLGQYWKTLMQSCKWIFPQRNFQTKIQRYGGWGS